MWLINGIKCITTTTHFILHKKRQKNPTSATMTMTTTTTIYCNRNELHVTSTDHIPILFWYVNIGYILVDSIWCRAPFNVHGIHFPLSQTYEPRKNAGQMATRNSLAEWVKFIVSSLLLLLLWCAARIYFFCLDFSLCSRCDSMHLCSYVPLLRCTHCEIKRRRRGNKTERERERDSYMFHTHITQNSWETFYAAVNYKSIWGKNRAKDLHKSKCHRHRRRRSSRCHTNEDRQRMIAGTVHTGTDRHTAIRISFL